MKTRFSSFVSSVHHPLKWFQRTPIDPTPHVLGCLRTMTSAVSPNSDTWEVPDDRETALESVHSLEEEAEVEGPSWVPFRTGTRGRTKTGKGTRDPYTHDFGPGVSTSHSS